MPKVLAALLVASLPITGLSFASEQAKPKIPTKAEIKSFLDVAKVENQKIRQALGLKGPGLFRLAFREWHGKDWKTFVKEDVRKHSLFTRILYKPQFTPEEAHQFTEFIQQQSYNAEGIEGVHLASPLYQGKIKQIYARSQARLNKELRGG